MTLQFTNHAIDRYIQFHMLDAVNPDPRDVRALLESHAPSAIKLPNRTHRGDTQWKIEALGCEMVSRHDDGIDVVVTILPPPRFRGLTPLQVEALEARRAAAHTDLRRLEADEVELESDRIAAKEAARVARDFAHQHEAGAALRLAEIRERRVHAQHEHEIMATALRSARHQLQRETDQRALLRALRIAIRTLRTMATVTMTYERTTELFKRTLDMIEDVNPRFVLNEFIDSEDA